MSSISNSVCTEQRHSSNADDSPRDENIGNNSKLEHEHEQMPAESSYNERHPDDGTKRFSATHLTPDCTAGTSINRQHSCSPSVASSRISQHSQVFPSVPDEEFIRRNTASWFERGKMFEISRSNENTIIAGSLMIVIDRKHSSIACLPLCRHPGIKGSERSFFKGRVSVYAKGMEPPSHLTACPCEPLEIALEEGRKLSDDVWVNIGEPQTIHHQEVEVALHGNMSMDDFRKLRGAYLNTQNSITDSDEEKHRNAFVLHAEILWAYITRGGIWFNQKIRIGFRVGG